jgi:hypothetical protein
MGADAEPKGAERPGGRTHCAPRDHRASGGSLSECSSTSGGSRIGHWVPLPRCTSTQRIRHNAAFFAGLFCLYHVDCTVHLFTHGHRYLSTPSCLRRYGKREPRRGRVTASTRSWPDLPPHRVVRVSPHHPHCTPEGSDRRRPRSSRPPGSLSAQLSWQHAFRVRQPECQRHARASTYTQLDHYPGCSDHLRRQGRDDTVHR